MATNEERKDAEELCRRLNAVPIGSVGTVYLANPLTLYGENDAPIGKVEDEGDGWFFVAEQSS